VLTHKVSLVKTYLLICKWNFNRKLKLMIRNLGSNITPKYIHRAAKALNQVCSQFKRDSDVTNNKPYYSMPSFNKDLEKW